MTPAGRGMRTRADSLAVALLVLFVLFAGACAPPPPPPPAQTAETAPAVLPPEPPREDLPRRAVTLLLPSTEAEGLRSVASEIFATASPIDQAKQLVGQLLSPPAQPGIAAPFPAGTLLRSVYLDSKGTAYVSLSRDAVTKAPGGSSWELLAVSSLAGTLQRSLPNVKRMQLLVEGEEIETLTGHLDLRAPVSLDDRLVDAR